MAVAFLSAIVSASGGKVANYFLNAGNVSERRGAVAREMAEAEKRKYNAPNPCVLQWDEKRMERYGEEQIRMPLVVSGDERPPKMLGSYELNDGKAATIKETVVKEAEPWGIGKKDGEAKPAMTLWDTTNTNSGN